MIFLGHLIDSSGIQADPQKTSTITDNVTELRPFMGMANQLGKFSNNLAELTPPLRELLSKKNQWLWGPAQDEAFNKVKTELSKPTVLALYDMDAETKVTADASAHGLGAVLMQKHEQSWRPVAYASRVMSPTECRYAPIEKEALALTWTCERFASYILWKWFLMETDHKPLVPLLSVKHSDNLPPRVLEFAYDWQGLTMILFMSLANVYTLQIHYPELHPTSLTQGYRKKQRC